MDDNKKQDLLLYLFRNCLFNIHNNSIELENVKCKSSKSRYKTFDLICHIVNKDEKSVILLMIKCFKEL